MLLAEINFEKYLECMDMKDVVGMTLVDSSKLSLISKRYIISTASSHIIAIKHFTL